jgi:hypothetical protein
VVNLDEIADGEQGHQRQIYHGGAETRRNTGLPYPIWRKGQT